jgi:predicted DNA binding CopG/RHH family protein
MKKPLNLPDFANEDQEREFWSEVSLADYFEPSDFQRVRLPNLKPSSEVISLRLPLSLLETIKVEAHKRDVPYQSYIKIKLDELFERRSKVAR